MAYIVAGGVIQDESNDLYWAAHVDNEGVIETDPTACSVALFLCDGDNTRTAVSGATESISAAPEGTTGVYNGKLSGVALTAGRLYYLEVSITADSTPRLGKFYLAVPVRAS